MPRDSKGLRQPAHTHSKATPQVKRVPSCKPYLRVQSVVVLEYRFATDGRSCRPLRGGSRRRALRSDAFPFLTVGIIPNLVVSR